MLVVGSESHSLRPAATPSRALRQGPGSKKPPGRAAAFIGKQARARHRSRQPRVVRSASEAQTSRDARIADEAVAVRPLLATLISNRRSSWRLQPAEAGLSNLPPQRSGGPFQVEGVPAAHGPR